MRQKETAAPGGGGGNHDQLRSKNSISNSGTQRSPINFVALGEMPVPPPRREIVEGLLAAGEVALLAGDPGAGKSALAVLLAASVTNGHPFCGREVERGPVLYAALERRAQTAARLWAAQSHELRTHVLDAQTLALTEEADALADAISAMAEPPRLLVIDTLARAMPGVEENSASDMGRVAAALATVQAAMDNGAIVLIHHLTKSASGKRSARGSTALLGAVDLELQVEASGSVRLATVTKANGIPEGAQFAFQIADADGTAVAVACDLPVGRGAAPVRDLNSARKEAAADRDDEAFRALSGRGHWTAKDAAKVLGEAGLLAGVQPENWTRKTRTILDRLTADGRAERLEGGAFAIRQGRTGRTGTHRGTHNVR